MLCALLKASKDDNLDDKEIEERWERKQLLLKQKEKDLVFLREEIGQVISSVSNPREMQQKDTFDASNEWSKHTRSQHQYGFLVRYLRLHFKIEMCTNAWVKMYEILCENPDLLRDCIVKKKLTTLHLCEAPGGFVAAIHYYLVVIMGKTDVLYNWKASSLNPFQEDSMDPIQDKRCLREAQFLQETLSQWDFLQDQTGDLLVLSNLKDLQLKYKDTKVSLVTADGGIGFQDPSELQHQEEELYHLKVAEVLGALMTLAPKKGTFILKMYTMFQPYTQSLICTLMSHFESVEVVKPLTSKPGSAEVYVIAKGFQDVHKDTLNQLFQVIEAKSFEPIVIDQKNFKQESIVDSMLEIAQRNIECIRRHLETFQVRTKWTQKDHKSHYFTQQMYATEFSCQYQIRLQEDHERIIQSRLLDGTSQSSSKDKKRKTVPQ